MATRSLLILVTAWLVRILLEYFCLVVGIFTQQFLVWKSYSEANVTDRVEAHSQSATATTSKWPPHYEVHVAVEGVDTSVHVNRSICCHKTYYLRQENINVVADVVAPCEWAFKLLLYLMWETIVTWITLPGFYCQPLVASFNRCWLAEAIVMTFIVSGLQTQHTKNLNTWNTYTVCL